MDETETEIQDFVNIFNSKLPPYGRYSRIRLTREESNIYYESLINHPNNKILLDIQPFLYIDMSHTKNKTYTILKNAYSLDLSFTDITDVSAFENTNGLSVYGCEGIEDFTMLGKVKRLNAGETQIGNSDIEKLGGLDTLVLTHTMISNVSALGNVRVLDLYGCSNITDISALTNVTYLNVTGCSNLSTIPIKNMKCHIIYTNECENLIDALQAQFYKCKHCM